MAAGTKELVPEIKMFGKWDSNVEIHDVSLKPYISLKSQFVPHTHGMWVAKAQKQKMNVVERLANRLMRSAQGTKKLSGHYVRSRRNCGKKLLALHIVRDAFEMVESEVKQNPVSVLIKAIENAGIREDITRVKRGGMTYSVAVDVSPLQRIDESLKNISLGTLNSSFKNKKSVERALADEILLAAKEDAQSFAIKRRNEIERMAKAAR